MQCPYCHKDGDNLCQGRDGEYAYPCGTLLPYPGSTQTVRSELCQTRQELVWGPNMQCPHCDSPMKDKWATLDNDYGYPEATCGIAFYSDKWAVQPLLCRARAEIKKLKEEPVTLLINGQPYTDFTLSGRTLTVNGRCLRDATEDYTVSHGPITFSEPLKAEKAVAELAGYKQREAEERNAQKHLCKCCRVKPPDQNIGKGLCWDCDAM